ncbi:MAG: hypothetical protein ACREQ5_23940 [Candidatus Dormibacteria bacterium]
MTEPVRQRTPRPSKGARTGRGTASVERSVEPPDPSRRKDEFEVRPVRDGAVRIAVVRAAGPAVVAIAAVTLQARTAGGTAALITALVAVPLLVGAILLLRRGVSIDRLYMTPAVVGEVSPLTGRKHEVDRAAIARVVDVVVEPIAPPSFQYVLFIDASNRCLLRVDRTYYRDDVIDAFVGALAVPRENGHVMNAKAVYRTWPGSIPWVLGRAGLFAVIGTVVILIGIIVGIAIFGGSGSN